MRIDFIDELTHLMEEHDDVVMVTLDIGYSMLETMQKRFPKRFINAGAAEQSGVSLASGLALSGYTVYVFGQAIFVTLRCYEQIRLDVSYQNVNVKLIGIAAGFSLDHNGQSHYALEDVGVMRLLPHMKIYTPGDASEARWVARESYATKGPAYIRLTKSQSPIVHAKPIQTVPSKGISLIQGTTNLIVVAGNMLPVALDVAKRLQQDRINIALVSLPIVYPITPAFITYMKTFKHIFSIEEHYDIGGLGSILADSMTMYGVRGTLHRYGVSQDIPSVSGKYAYLMEHAGLSADQLYKSIRRTLKE